MIEEPKGAKIIGTGCTVIAAAILVMFHLAVVWYWWEALYKMAKAWWPF